MMQQVDRWYTRAIERIARGRTWSLAGGIASAADPLRQWIAAVGAAVGGVLLVSILIGVITAFVRINNISLLYLVMVIGLAIGFGRRAAILGAILAFLAYDYFFIPPIHQWTVDNPTEWLSLGALLLTGLVVAQLTAEVSRREQLALASQQRTALLYTLAQAIASETDQEPLFHLLTERLVTVFGQAGISATMLWLPGDEGQLMLRATVHAAHNGLHHLDGPAYQAQATAAARDRRMTALVELMGVHTHLTAFLPLISSKHVVGVLGLQGTTAMLELFTHLQLRPPDLGPMPAANLSPSALAVLFAAFCDQYALALERSALQQEAIHAAALRESDRLKNAFLGSVTHDLRTPIAAIQAAASSLLQPDIAWTTAERDELIAAITTSSGRLGHLVDNLLILSGLEAQAPPLPRQLYPINDVIATVLDQLEWTGTTQGRPIQLDFAEDPLEAPMDHAQIERVVMNLIENAIKYSPPGSPILIRAWRAVEENELRVSVTDHGIGIPPSQREAIFDRFYRLQRPLPWTKDMPPAGTGLGLAICAGIVHEHGGRIWVESVEGQGATFTFTLPLAEVAGSALAPQAAALRGGS